jgi:hypothetical protein
VTYYAIACDDLPVIAAAFEGAMRLLRDFYEGASDVCVWQGHVVKGGAPRRRPCSPVGAT